MRDINVWAYHTDFGSLCRNAQLDNATGLSYPVGTSRDRRAGTWPCRRYKIWRSLSRSPFVPDAKSSGSWRLCAGMRRHEEAPRTEIEFTAVG